MPGMRILHLGPIPPRCQVSACCPAKAFKASSLVMLSSPCMCRFTPQAVFNGIVILAVFAAEVKVCELPHNFRFHMAFNTSMT